MIDFVFEHFSEVRVRQVLPDPDLEREDVAFTAARRGLRFH
jgi:hypothetical protein